MPIISHLEFYVRAAIAIVCVFLVCVTLHEFGHFYVAKKSGVAVPIFSIGFGPKLVKWNRGGTEYSIRLLPLGGFVQMAGEAPQETWFPVGQEVAYELDDELRIIRLGDPKDLKHGYVGTVRRVDLTDAMEMAIDTAEGIRTFPVKPYARVMLNARSSIPVVEKHEQMLGKPLWKRAAVILAGPVMNFLLAGVLFAIVNMHTGIPTTTIGQVEPHTPAHAAGLQVGDKIIQIDNRAIHSWDDLRSSIQADLVSGAAKPKPLHLMVSRDGQTRPVTVTPAIEKNGEALIGIESTMSYNPLRTVPAGFSEMVRDTGLTVQAYGQLVWHHQFSSLSGPVGIADVISQQARLGFWNVVMIAGVLSLNLGMFNLIPIPALDGGRLLFMIIELVRGRKVDPQKEGFVHFVGFALLMLFAVVITYRDVTHLF
ncbi:RIP metalloprotease RseP [Alicyclobacillus fastidiosus]|uniref:Zinc metalloprotease n=1 Tax=Alicyclobacillus fastidiosus TaxID=392011 RepID=A0ABV5AIF5_9BACL|nr:RIP metalloprotease RseP [Alicyclobacillus fastidiosus]WEH07897.1 RIP metalloprotease RseP [Alicyclobacillus fastidiosus]